MATPTTITEKDVLSPPDEIKKMTRSELMEFLRRHKELDLDEEELRIFEKQKVSGRDFFLLTKKDLLAFNLPGGPAIRIAEFINELKKPRSTGLVHVYIDNSNVFIEGKFNIGQLEYIFDAEKILYHINQLHIEYGQLLALVQDGHGLGGAPVLVGSRLPPNDSLWKRIQKQGYEVTVYDQNAENRKKVDMEIGASMMDTIQNYNPGILVLIAGDGDYVPVINRVLNKGWAVEIWFWSSGISNDLKSKVLFKPLDICYKYFSCGYGPEPTGKKQVLEITDGDTIQDWRDKEGQLERAKHWMEVNYPDIRVWEKKEIKRRSWAY
ncbi:21428_t:CDS:2 [Entrophospora sp. SA101]|nr:21428_t:CDS:2 [Entrophospora sp. SA101]